jgi:hypothetical protein
MSLTSLPISVLEMPVESPQALSELRYEGDAFTSALGFTPAELAENRRGRIAASQADRLSKQAGLRLTLAVMAFVVLSAMASLLVLVSVGELRSSQVFGAFYAIGIHPPVVYVPLAAIILSVVSIGVFVDLWFGVLKVMALQKDLSVGRVDSTEGWASFNSELVWGFSLSARCWMVVNKDYFEITARGPMELPTRAPCRVYFTPRSHMVLAVEEV